MNKLKNKIMSEPISNEIFETFRIRERVKEQKKAIKLLAEQGYTILDLENNIINKNTIKESNI
tara:strand:+ start:314 stop:502 length:189 start_codon:yes stop_codon:yes gene_type:complete